MGDSLEGPSTELIGILGAIILGAVFASIDAALVALGEPRARALREGDDANAKEAARYLRDRSPIHTRLFLGRVVCLSAAAVLASRVAFRLDGAAAGVAAVASVAAAYALMAVFAQTWAASRAGRVAMPLLRFLRPLELAMLPLAVPLGWAGVLANRLMPPRPEDDPYRITELEVEHLIEQGEEKGSITEEHAELLRSVLEFTETVAREVMVPRTRTVAIEINTPVAEISDLIVEKGHSRYPVYRDRIDHIEGVLYAKDLFRAVHEHGEENVDIARIIRKPPFFAVESQKVRDLLREMQLSRIHLAIVVDEFGGVSGMVTLEDIIEEIVGEIRDEHDREELPIREIAPGRYLADADVSVYDLAALVGMELPDQLGDYDSLGGMIVDLAGKVPTAGEAIEVGTYDLIVRDADERHVTRVEVVPHEPNLSPSAAE